MSSNGVFILTTYELDSLGPLGTPYMYQKEFSVNCALNEETINGKKVPIVDRQMVLHLEIVRGDESNARHATIGAFWLQNLS